MPETRYGESSSFNFVVQDTVFIPMLCEYWTVLPRSWSVFRFLRNGNLSCQPYSESTSGGGYCARTAYKRPTGLNIHTKIITSSETNTRKWLPGIIPWIQKCAIVFLSLLCFVDRSKSKHSTHLCFVHHYWENENISIFLPNFKPKLCFSTTDRIVVHDEHTFIYLLPTKGSVTCVWKKSPNIQRHSQINQSIPRC